MITFVSQPRLFSLNQIDFEYKTVVRTTSLFSPNSVDLRLDNSSFAQIFKNSLEINHDGCFCLKTSVLVSCICFE